jgi:hypothetical protein
MKLINEEGGRLQNKKTSISKIGILVKFGTIRPVYERETKII